MTPTTGVSASYYYCHGLPGHPGEVRWALAGLSADVTALERLTTQGDSYTACTLAGFDEATSGAPESVSLIGFSLGAMAALTIAAYRPGRIQQVHLIAPAAPLQLGDYLDRMAGKAVFSAARSGHRHLATFTSAQALAFRIAPRGLAKALFSKAPANEKALLKDPDFAATLHDGLRLSLRKARKAYEAELLHYVSDWSKTVRMVSAPVTLWHGDADTWAPLQMSTDLAERLTNARPLKTFPDCSHYLALQSAIRAIYAGHLE